MSGRVAEERCGWQVCQNRWVAGRRNDLGHLATLQVRQQLADHKGVERLVRFLTRSIDDTRTRTVVQLVEGIDGPDYRNLRSASVWHQQRCVDQRRLVAPAGRGGRQGDKAVLQTEHRTSQLRRFDRDDGDAYWGFWLLQRKPGDPASAAAEVVVVRHDDGGGVLQRTGPATIDHQRSIDGGVQSQRRDVRGADERNDLRGSNLHRHNGDQLHRLRGRYGDAEQRRQVQRSGFAGGVRQRQRLLGHQPAGVPHQRQPVGAWRPVRVVRGRYGP